MLLRVALLFIPWAGIGCSVDEKEEVGIYRRLLDGDNPATVSYSPEAPLDLVTALRLANFHNERLAIEGENYLQALIDKQRAAAAFQPTVSLAPRYFIEQETDTSFGGGGVTDPDDPDDPDGNDGGGFGGRGQENEYFETSVNANANLFNGFRDVANLRRAGRTIRQREALLLDLQQDVLLEVAQVYYEVIGAEQLVDVLESTARLQEERVRNARAREQAGFGRALDVAQQTAQAAATRVTLLAARGDVWTGRTTLAFLTDARVADCPLVDDYDVPENLPPAEEWAARAAAARQDLAAARAATAAAAEGVRAAVGQYYPSVTLDFDYYLVRTGSRADDGDWEALLLANVPIFSGGQIHADVRAALSQLRQARLAESLTGRQVEQDVLLAYRALSTGTERLAQLAVQEQAARDAFVRARREYDAGTATNLDLLTAQDTLLSTELQLTSERFARKVAYLNLLRAGGTLGESMRLPVARSDDAAGLNTPGRDG